MTYGVVAFSIIVQGLTVGRVFKADRLARLLPKA
jgi:NhaP-type Na+/H+ or K+/H+ antiporter